VTAILALWLLIATYIGFCAGIGFALWSQSAVPVAPDEVPVTPEPARRFDYECAVSRN
jgi:hypothetical protein